MQLIDGKATAATIKEEIAAEVKAIVDAGGKRPHLVACRTRWRFRNIREEQGYCLRAVWLQIYPHTL